MPKTHSVKPGVGEVLVEELTPEEQNSLSTGGSIEVSGGSVHDQLKLARVLEIGHPTLKITRILIDTEHTLAERAKLQERFVGCAKGDIIAFQSLSAHKLRVDGKQYLLVDFEHVKAVVS